MSRSLPSLQVDTIGISHKLYEVLQTHLYGTVEIHTLYVKVLIHCLLRKSIYAVCVIKKKNTKLFNENKYTRYFKKKQHRNGI